MTRDELQTFTQRFVQTWERGDERALAGCYAEDATLDSPMFQTVKGRERIEQSYRDLFRVFERWRITVNDIIIDTTDTPRVALLTTSQLTHAGAVFGHPGSGRRITLRTVLLFRFDRGLITSESRLYDFTGLLVQLGVLKAKGS